MIRSVRRLAPLSLALALTLALPLPAFAAETVASAPPPGMVVAAPLAPAAPAAGVEETPDETTARLNATVKARLDAAQAHDRARAQAFAAETAAYEARLKADADAQAAIQAQYEAEKAAVAAAHAADMAAWEARAAACKGGDRSQCAQK